MRNIVPLCTSRKGALLSGRMESLCRCLRNPSACVTQVCHGDLRLGSYSGMCADESQVQLGNTRDFKQEHIWIRTEHIWCIRVAVCLQHHCIVCAMSHFLPLLYSLGKLLSYLHKITFGKHLPFPSSVARLPRSLNVSSRDAAQEDELCQDLWALQGWITGCYSMWCPMLRYPVVSLRNICQLFCWVAWRAFHVFAKSWSVVSFF